ncbi:MAG: ATP-grasp domain-containing protein [Candidatus Moranbacteria bacterium]|nr:ATP-grasp domain-containing protein [Candidatus Moranbacteria bacterium]
MKKNILVFPCGSEIALEIHNALKWSTHVALFGGSSVSNHGEYVYSNYIGDIPDVEDADFIERMEEIVQKYAIDFIFPAHDSVVLKLVQNKQALSCGIISSPVETCETCRSKKKTYDFLRGSINVPQIYASADEIRSYPVFLKPDVGQGSRGTYTASCIEDIEFYAKKDPTLLMLEYLPGKEYTIDCFTDKNRELLFSGARERGRISGGISVRTFPADMQKFRSMAEKINQKLLFHGAWFFQVKEDRNGELSLLEVAPRIAGSMALYRNLGVNFPLLSIFDTLGIDVRIMPNQYGIVMDRALFNRFRAELEYRHVYIDLDDTIIFDGKVNPVVMAYLYQCFNEGIKIHLLSRHKERFGEDIRDVLKKFRISEVFDSIDDIGVSDSKDTYINEYPSIFIDDSFQERLAVYEKKAIPTFEVSSLESLISWKK